MLCMFQYLARWWFFRCVRSACVGVLKGTALCGKLDGHTAELKALHCASPQECGREAEHRHFAVIWWAHVKKERRLNFSCATHGRMNYASIPCRTWHGPSKSHFLYCRPALHPLLQFIHFVLVVLGLLRRLRSLPHSPFKYVSVCHVVASGRPLFLPPASCPERETDQI